MSAGHPLPRDAAAVPRPPAWKQRQFQSIGRRPYLRRRAEELAALRFERIGLRPLAATVGAEVEGVDLREPLDGETFAEIRRAFLAWRVLFFRDQPISAEQHVAFARRFGELEGHPVLPTRDAGGALVIFAKDAETTGYENLWHADVTFRECPALGAMLRAVEVPALGGDTLFADMVAAYEGLAPETKRRIDGLRAIHDFGTSFGLGLPAEERERKRRELPPVSHPVVRTHPETGERALFVNPIFTDHVEGVSAAESDALLEQLFREAQVPEYQCRFRWTVDAIALWDNRAVQHYAVNDYWPARRVMERATIAGDRPV